jgi:hypothetical protein
MEKNIACPKCGANAFHLHRLSDGKYVVKCMRRDGCEREIYEDGTILNELKAK